VHSTIELPYNDAIPLWHLEMDNDNIPNKLLNYIIRNSLMEPPVYAIPFPNVLR